MRCRVLVLGQEAVTRARCSRALAMQGLVTAEVDCEQPIARLAMFDPELIVIDASVPLPRMLEHCRELRSTLAVPLLVQLGVASERAELMCFSAGASDVVRTTTAPTVLAARARRLLPGAVTLGVKGTLRLGMLALDRDSRRLLCASQPVELWRPDFAVLEALMARPQHVLERAALKRIAWDGECTDGALESSVHRIRKLVSAAGGPRVIVSVRGVGYRLGLPAGAAS